MPLWFAETFYFSPLYSSIAALGCMHEGSAPKRPAIFATEWTVENLKKLVETTADGLDYIFTGSLRRDGGEYVLVMRVWEVKKFRERKQFTARWTAATADAELAKLHEYVRAFMEWVPYPEGSGIPYSAPSAPTVWLDALGALAEPLPGREGPHAQGTAPALPPIFDAFAPHAFSPPASSLAWISLRLKAVVARACAEPFRGAPEPPPCGGPRPHPDRRLTAAKGLHGMHQSTSDLRIRATTPLPAPSTIEEEIPLDDPGSTRIARARQEISAIMAGRDDRLLVVVGPCSIHDPAAALEYAGLLRSAADRHAGEILVAMRVYFEKPRTVVGWKGLINDPDLDGTFRIGKGLRIARKLMVDVTAYGLPIATEFLDTTLGQYYADLVSWGAIGARTVESQVHRELASGLSMPVGFKNRTDGDVQVAVDAIRSARHPHWFPSLARDGSPACMQTTGNEDTHLVLRGGSRGPNYLAENVRSAVRLLVKSGLPPHLMVDCSHANSGKDAERQADVASELAARIAGGDRGIAAVMIESNLLGGSQDYRAVPLARGQSVTDSCLSWDKTAPVIARLADAVIARRRSPN